MGLTIVRFDTMPLTVITLTKVPAGLKGDLSKWMQEISVGVYIGNFSVRIREHLWEKVLENIGDGEATLSYYCQNEIGYNFETTNSSKKMVDFDGIPLVKLQTSSNDGDQAKYGFSNASKYQKAKKFSTKKNNNILQNYVVLDLETTGLDLMNDHIIEVGCIKVIGDKTKEFQSLIKINMEVPAEITELTGISNKKLNDTGASLKSVLTELMIFIDNHTIIGYNLKFDIDFLNYNLNKVGLPPLINNKIIDVLKIVRRKEKLLSNYKLKTVLKYYGISTSVPHRALADSKLINKLFTKLNEI